MANFCAPCAREDGLPDTDFVGWLTGEGPAWGLCEGCGRHLFNNVGKRACSGDVHESAHEDACIACSALVSGTERQRGAVDPRLLDLRSRSALAVVIQEVLREHDCSGEECTACGYRPTQRQRVCRSVAVAQGLRAGRAPRWNHESDVPESSPDDPCGLLVLPLTGGRS